MNMKKWVQYQIKETNCYLHAYCYKLVFVILRTWHPILDFFCWIDKIKKLFDCQMKKWLLSLALSLLTQKINSHFMEKKKKKRKKNYTYIQHLFSGESCNVAGIGTLAVGRWSLNFFSIYVYVPYVRNQKTVSFSLYRHVLSRYLLSLYISVVLERETKCPLSYRERESSFSFLSHMHCSSSLAERCDWTLLFLSSFTFFHNSHWSIYILLPSSAISFINVGECKIQCSLQVVYYKLAQFQPKPISTKPFSYQLQPVFFVWIRKKLVSWWLWV